MGKICGPHSWCPLTTYLPTYFVCIFRNYPTKIHNRTPHIIYMLCIATASFGDRVTFTTSDEYLLYISWYDESFNKNTRFFYQHNFPKFTETNLSRENRALCNVSSISEWRNLQHMWHLFVNVDNTILSKLDAASAHVIPTAKKEFKEK